MKFEGRNNSSILDKVSKQNKMNKSKLELRLNLFEFEPKCVEFFKIYRVCKSTTNLHSEIWSNMRFDCQNQFIFVLSFK